MDKSAAVFKINQHTTLIDVGMRGLAGAAAVYLVEGAGRSCLIDAGTRAEAPRVVSLLTELDAFPPDIIITTHAHHDHAQGIPTLRSEAKERGQRIEVLASAKCIPLLADATYNEVFDNGPYQSIENASPVGEGDTIDLGSVKLTIFELPGHSEDHIGILDEASGTLFVGDALGLNVGGVYLPPFVPPSWDPDAFRASASKVLQIGYENLCLTHFGCLRGDEARQLPEKALARTQAWWRLFLDNAGRLDDPGFLYEAVQQELETGVPALKMVTPAKGARARATGTQETGGEAPPPGEVFMRGLVAKLGLGCRMFQKAHTTRS